MIAKTYEELTVIEKDNEIVLFDPETFVVFTPNKPEQYKESVHAFLEKKASIKQKNSSQNTKFFQAASSGTNGLLIYFLITNNCNLRCSYCFADGGSYGQTRGHMEKQTIDQTLHFLNKNFPDIDELRILFFGGEPCLYPDLMEYTENTTKAIFKNKKVIFTCTTNGTIFSERLKSFFKDHNVGVAVSLDGPECAQNCLRRTATGVGSYNLVKKNLKNLKGINNILPILVTVTPQNMDLTKTYLHFKELGVNYIRFTPATLQSDSSLCFTDDNITFLKNELTKLAALYLKDLLEEEHPLEIENFASIRAILENRKRYSNCALGKKIIAVTPQGDLYPCPHFIGEERYCLGNVNSTFDKEAFQKYFHKNHVDKKPKCATCPVKNLCGGDCYKYLDNKHNGPNNMSSILCEIFKHQVHLSIWMYSKLYKAGFFEKNLNKPNTVKNKSVAVLEEC